ncbi:hypothetical protein F511_19983 [Dorcoceras hygrometricum]|uniref:Uncharacterized protein n=1 Tax=Dorcoceras hygrometricum TaxID=472368 RepID=A0A2Z7BMW3_9LAMI|nr:hypothetical protein F511_19983 [Dorcoceras hygrometricum]
MLRLVPDGGIACVCLLVVQQKRISTRVNIPVVRRGNVVVWMLRLEVQLRVIFATVACCWYFTRASDWMTSVERRRLALLEKSAVGSCVCWLVGTCWFGKLIVSTGFVGGQLIVLISVVASAIYRKAWSSNCDINSTLSKYFPRLCSSFRTLEHCSAVSFSGDFPAFPMVVLLMLLPESSGFPCDNQRVLIIAQKYKVFGGNQKINLHRLDPTLSSCTRRGV